MSSPGERRGPAGRQAWLAPAAVLAAAGVGLALAWPRDRLVDELAHPGRRTVAYQELLERGPDAVPDLLAAVRDPARPLEVRAQALELLGRIGDRRALPAVLEVGGPGLAVARLEALARLGGPEATAELLAALDAGQVELEQTALYALAESGEGDEVAARLLEHLEHHRPGHRALAARALGRRRHAAAVPALAERLRDDDPSVREAAASALLRLGTPEAVEAVDAAVSRGQVALPE